MSNLKKYAAKLLFQHRVEIDGISNKMRKCEECIIILTENCAADALKKAMEQAIERENFYRNDEYSEEYGCECYNYFEFIGVSDLLHLGLESENNEVWYDIKMRLNPMERKHIFIPEEERLNAIVCENKSNV